MALGLRQLRYFIAIADAGVLSRAAEALNIAQSALSHHVAALETELAVKLLERKARGIALTAAGRRLYEHASAVLSALGKAEEDVRSYTEAAAGPVCIGLSHTAISMVALDIMKAVRNKSPGVHLTVVEALSPALIERVFSGTVDLALTYNPPRDARLHVERLGEEDLYLVGHSSLIGRSSGPIAFSAIPQRSVLGLTPMPASRAIIQTQVLRNQIIPSATLEVDSLSALRMAIEAGLGCAILSRSSVLTDLAAGKYHARRIVDPPLTRTLALIALADRPQTKAFVEVRQTMIEVVRAAVADGRWPATASGRRIRRRPHDDHHDNSL
ncbi:LysR family transcriptional regulator [Bradyrhizobium sp.]|uniref:LysR family transcriptional regulator n=1 Tax=Bradyrhizobium sp. TaxID=376 RepID=UPI002CBDF232|nr:LysR substrate-binding domain-containing protein [Bradyrhizobium sp.]HMM91467.1 LysR substrate-binding domain-containing protein [Bradyrhizobium sp.]